MEASKQTPASLVHTVKGIIEEALKKLDKMGIPLNHLDWFTVNADENKADDGKSKAA